MRTYKYEITVTEAACDFWNLLPDGHSGCDDVTTAITDSLLDGESTAGLNIEIKLVEYTNKGN